MQFFFGVLLVFSFFSVVIWDISKSEFRSSYTLALSPHKLKLARGETIMLKLQVIRKNGYQGRVRFSLEGDTQDVLITFMPRRNRLGSKVLLSIHKDAVLGKRRLVFVGSAYYKNIKRTEFDLEIISLA